MKTTKIPNPTLPSRKLIIALSLLVSITSMAACSNEMLAAPDRISADDALKRFYENQGPEDTLMDPLILAGSSAVPRVLKEISNKNMPRRRYAIAFLGNGSYSEAVPILEPILADSSEEDYIRGECLHSIYLIDESRAKQLAQEYGDREDYLGKISLRIKNGDVELKKRRSHSDAMLEKHQ